MSKITLTNGATVTATMEKGPMAFGARHRYNAVGSIAITEHDAREIQNALGYHPDGYGLYGFKTTITDGNSTATWWSSVRAD